MALRTLFAGLLLFGVLRPGAADDRPPPSLEDDVKSLAGKWEPKAAKGAGKVTLEFERVKARKEMFLTTRLYDIRPKVPELIDLHSGRISFKDEKGKRFFVCQGTNQRTKVFYTLKGERLILDGEYESGETLYRVTGEYVKIKAK
jgi:hypothetical protein